MLNRRTIAGLTLSFTGFIAIAGWEGYRSTSYDDGVGVQTIGFGTTQNVQNGDTIDVITALKRVGADVARTEAELKQCIHVPLAQNEWDAYVSWAYNVGTNAACKSTLVKKLNLGDYVGACHELSRWNKAGGRVLRGLVRRREAEKLMCLGAAHI